LTSAHNQRTTTFNAPSPLQANGTANQTELEACNSTQIARCAARRTGVLCGRCQDTYYAKGNSCLECPSMTYSIVGFVLIVIFMAFVLNVLFKSDAKASKMMTKYKVVIGFVQLLGRLGNTFNDIKWPGSVLDVGNIIDIINLDISLGSSAVQVSLSYF
jgi:hypothetical protein